MTLLAPRTPPTAGPQGQLAAPDTRRIGTEMLRARRDDPRQPSPALAVMGRLSRSCRCCASPSMPPAPARAGEAAPPDASTRSRQHLEQAFEIGALRPQARRQLRLANATQQAAAAGTRRHGVGGASGISTAARSVSLKISWCGGPNSHAVSTPAGAAAAKVRLPSGSTTGSLPPHRSSVGACQREADRRTCSPAPRVKRASRALMRSWTRGSAR